MKKMIFAAGMLISGVIGMTVTVLSSFGAWHDLIRNFFVGGIDTIIFLIFFAVAVAGLAVSIIELKKKDE